MTSSVVEVDIIATISEILTSTYENNRPAYSWKKTQIERIIYFSVILKLSSSRLYQSQFLCTVKINAFVLLPNVVLPVLINLESAFQYLCADTRTRHESQYN